MVGFFLFICLGFFVSFYAREGRKTDLRYFECRKRAQEEYLKRFVISILLSNNILTGDYLPFRKAGAKITSNFYKF